MIRIQNMSAHCQLFQLSSRITTVEVLQGPGVKLQRGTWKPNKPAALCSSTFASDPISIASSTFANKRFSQNNTKTLETARLNNSNHPRAILGLSPEAHHRFVPGFCLSFSHLDLEMGRFSVNLVICALGAGKRRGKDSYCEINIAQCEGFPGFSGSKYSY